MSNADNRVELRIMGISYNPLKSGAFALLLAQVDGPYRIPIMIGALEAQSIAIKIEGVVTPRPVTHDLFCSLTMAFGLNLEEVFIYKFEDGIFYSELTYTDGEKTVVLEARTSDAIGIAIRTNAPIYTTEEILLTTGAVFETNIDNLDDDDIDTDDDGTETVDINTFGEAHAMSYEDLPTDSLEEMLNDLIAVENYEEAAKISEILKRRKTE